MSLPYIGEIRIFAGNFAPVGWAFCDGSTMAISQNDVLFALIGTTYGGNGTTTFNLPDLHGRLPLGMGQGPGLSNYALGQSGGTEGVTLTAGQMPAHNHTPQASLAAGDQPSPQNNVWSAAATGAKLYSTAAPGAAMNTTRIGLSGGSQPHENRMPTLAISFIISLFGIFPTQN